MDARVLKELESEEPSEFHGLMLEHCKGLVSLSSGSMSTFYTDWDKQQDAYNAKVRDTTKSKENDKQACESGNPQMQSLSVPLTYSQVQTFVAFGMGLLFQRDRFYELEGTGEEDHKSAKLGESLLEQNLIYNNMTQKVYQFLLDIGRFSIGIIKHSWEQETETVWVEQPVPQSLTPMSLLGRVIPQFQQEQKMEEVRTERVRYQGNKLYSISPYRFYPDPRLPMTRFQEGEFCASEDEYSMTALRKGEQSGIYAGVKHIDKFKKEDFEKRSNTRFNHVKSSLATSIGRQQDQSAGSVVLTEVQVEIVPSEFKLGDGEPLGPETTPSKWLVAYANDNRVIRCEPMGYEHNNFTYSVGQFSPDQHNFMNETIAQMIGKLQDVIDWFLNSHISNVRKHITNRLVVDPSGVVYDDLKNHRAVIRIKPEAAKQGVDRYIKQLTTTDVTRGHIADVGELIKFAQMTTAISDNLMGQFHSGRRSAREANNVSAASGARLRNVIKLLFSTAFEPLGRDMLANLRDGLTEEIFVTVTGDEFPDWETYEGFRIADDRVKVPVTRATISGKFDFKVFEGTLPSEKGMQADTLEGLLENLLKNPQGMQMILQLGYDPAKLLKEVLELRGIKHPDRFKVDQIRLQEYQQQAAELTQLENGQQPIQPGVGGQLPPNGGGQVPQGTTGLSALLTGAGQGAGGVPQ